MKAHALVVLGLLAVSLPALTRPADARQARYEHRVVVPTTAVNRDADLAASLERNVNALAARGFELTAIAGGDGAVLDTMLARSTQGALTEHAAVTLAVMARPVGGRPPAREYRLLHVGEREAVAQAIAPLGPAGFRLAIVEFDGLLVHLAFEKAAGLPAVEYREFRNRGRQSWMDQLLADPDVRARMTRVVPVALGAGIVELGPPKSEAGHVQWMSKPTHAFTQLEAPIRALAKTGYGVELVRRRGPNDLDVLLVKPAGVTASASVFDLDDGPWGSPCGRGTLAGAAVGPDGDVYCVADTGGPSPASNRGLDLTVRPVSGAGGAMLVRGPTCDVLARLSSTRPASSRLAFALQLEQEIASAIEPGFRVSRLVAATDTRQQARLVAFTTNAPLHEVKGPPADRSPVPALAPELDTLGDDLARQREAALNEALLARGLEGRLWVELEGGRSRAVRLLGCVPTRVARENAESAARGLLVNQGLSNYRLDSRVIVER